MNLATFTWDPDRNFFVIPYLNHPVTWYGFLFAIGFLVGYVLVRKMFAYFLAESSLPSAEVELASVKLTDRLSLFVIIGTIVGARLGHVFFYGWSYYKQNPTSIFKVWEGGLASHGGAIGVLIGLFLFLLLNKNKKITLLVLLDILVVPAAFVGGCIRIGNFINQEITGIPTSLPWGVTFLHPIDGLPGVPVHPTQLYESMTYFLIFFLLYFLWRKRPAYIGCGLLGGCFFTLVFGARFLIEFVKMPQSEWPGPHFPLSMGQLLSIPFFVLGIALLIYSRYREKHAQ